MECCLKIIRNLITINPNNMKTIIQSISVFLILLFTVDSFAQDRDYMLKLRSVEVHGGDYEWHMIKASEVSAAASSLSSVGYDCKGWSKAVVPGTVLNSLVHNGVYPEPYFGLNNMITESKIPDLSNVGHEFYTYWFRTEFTMPVRERGERIWMQIDGINYRAEFWLNGKMVYNLAGMFRQETVDVTDYLARDAKNVLAVKVYPIDEPGGPRKGKSKTWGAAGEFRNGGNGEIGKNVTMLMTVGWDFTFLDGIRDRNTGIWKDISFFKTNDVMLKSPFVKSTLKKPSYDESAQVVSVEVVNPGFGSQKVTVSGEIEGEGIVFQKDVFIHRGMTATVTFTPEEFPQLVMSNPRLWWPVNKGKPDLYNLVLKVERSGRLLDSIRTSFGIREIMSHTNTPDGSRTFVVNGRPVFIKGTNWLPENMLRTSDDRTYAELRYTAQSGVNMIRFWGGGITESDYFFDLCDRLGIMVWMEFWMTGDTKHPIDKGLYFQNAASAVKRVRNHPSLAYYVCSNESTEMAGLKELLTHLDGTRGYQMQSECSGIHDGSPYKTVNPMRHYENTASDRGSRVDGFNPEYGAPCLPTVECLREMMPEEDLWPINKKVWDYSDGNGFHQMATLYKYLTDQYGESEGIEEYAMKGQFVGAMNYKSIWEVWNYNKLHYGDRYTSGFLFWYHNSPIRQVCGRMWDWSLEPTAALYASSNACEPIHPQFDYLKNTVSAVNDYFQECTNYRIEAQVWDIDSKMVWKKTADVDIPGDGVANDIFKVEFPENISSVHFIKLYLYDSEGIQVGSNFYWRSNDIYKGKDTMTGPCTSGFQGISELDKASVSMKFNTYVKEDRHYINIKLKNSPKAISFFTQIKFLDKNGKPVRPSFYTDNFMSLMPGETRDIIIETALKDLPQGEYSLVLTGYNLDKTINTVVAR